MPDAKAQKIGIFLYALFVSPPLTTKDKTAGIDTQATTREKK